MQPDRNAMSDADFAAELRAWLEAVYPPDWRDPLLRLRGRDAEWWYARQWQDGWRAPAWPREHGGLGLSVEKLILYHRVTEDFGIARTLDHGVKQVGPILVQYGTEAQRAACLRPILEGTQTWCQGYSEPGAGSDLAALRTRAEREGDSFRVNGQKIWTTQAEESTHLYFLARTSAAPKKQMGISLFLVRRNAPGITVRPIRNLLGEREFYEVFFDDLIVRADAVVGAVDQGWTVAKALLGHERFAQGSPALARHTYRLLCTMAGPLGAFDDPAFADRIARLGCELSDADALYAENCAGVASGADLGDSLPIAKLVAAELFQAMAECLQDLAAEAKARPGCGVPVAWIDEAARVYLMSRPYTIFGGTAEVQRNIMARSLLALRG